MVSVENVTVRFGGFTLLDGITLLVSPKERIGLVGKNGAGKSTLIKIFTGMVKPDEGTAVVPGNISTGYLPQQMVTRDDTTVFQETEKAFAELKNLEKEINQLNQLVATREDYESESYTGLLAKLADATERYELLGGGSTEAKVEQTLLGLGFTPADFNKPTSTFSGGWRMRVELAKILLKNPDLLLLDEPTNHLDIESIQWLEEFLKSFGGALILISHDRAFLNAVTTRTVEISLGKLHDYKVPYNEFIELRRERREQQMAAYRNQQKEIGDTEAFIERFRYKATKAVQVQSRVKQLEKMDRIEVEEEDHSTINIKFPPAAHSGRIMLELEELSKSYGEKEVLKNIDLILERGEKVAFVGKNGEGKTTLSRIIVGELNHQGTLKLGHNVHIGYFAQNQDDLMDGEKTVLETIDKIAVGNIRARIRDILGAFLFRGEDVDKKVKVLSGGERSRLALAKLLFQPYNMLVLDEPTNHLDMRSKDILKRALNNYDGTLIVVSHDREFMDGLVQKVYEFKNKKIKEYLGGIYDFLEKKKMSNLRELEWKNEEKKKPAKEKVSTNKLSYEERKEIDKLIRKTDNKVEETEKKITGLENSLSHMNSLFANPDQIGGNENESLFEKYEMLKKELTREMHNWEKLQYELDILNEKRFGK